MTILATNTAGTFSGSHQTAVAATNKQILCPSAKRHPTFGFTVQWQFSAPAVTGILCPCWEWGPPCLMP
ncbi:hypothetical protein DV515_00011056 [Chloebia gouldiae]|uniref:Uncharacterized protein n=1 Tax=Chloebia gouldiae TaxID=44316 RepID=A0A3L8S7G6_CHLGU|nr:hypothetical protein DV515_00011056 [Chloebia gouldiae]